MSKGLSSHQGHHPERYFPVTLILERVNGGRFPNEEKKTMAANLKQLSLRHRHGNRRQNPSE
ncbi:MAG TPA: hypothetical protein VJ508_10445 [Saprospiraceae bacterium]|nr:hypothetical protein [Saprospiraceae bacterium]